MRTFKLYSMLVVLLSCALCAAPPTCHRVAVDTTLTRPEGVFLMADVCIQKDAVGDSDDYFCQITTQLYDLRETSEGNVVC